jgi:8-oxo-dGTP diphosphatase
MTKSEHAVILLHEGRKVLFVRRSASKKFMPHAWAFASGTIKKGEIPKQTALREAKEELGLDVTIEKELFTIHLVLPDDWDAKLHVVLCANTLNQPIVFDQAEIQDYQFLTFGDFFKKYRDEEIDHVPRYLRNHPELWTTLLT